MALYHYTDVTGLKGIIDNESIWATDIRYLNDSKELIAGIEQVKTLFDKFRDTSIVTDFEELGVDISNFKNYLELKEFRSLIDKIEEVIVSNLNKRNIYISSFTDKRDNLRQWMSYCPSNAGYCIVFDNRQLGLTERQEHKLGYVANFEKVYYGEIEALLKSECMNIFEVLKGYLNSEIDSANEKIFSMVSRLLFHCCAFKGKEFYDESETRIIMQSNLNKTNAREYRTKSGLLIPYMKYPMPKNSIKEIIIGPNINSELAKQGLEDYLYNKGVNCKVSQSACSLRVY